MYISAFFPGTSSALTVAASDKVEECPGAVPESVCQTDPTSMQVHIEKAAVTSAREKGKMSGKRMIQNPMPALLQDLQRTVVQARLFFLFLQLYEIKH